MLLPANLLHSRDNPDPQRNREAPSSRPPSKPPKPKLARGNFESTQVAEAQVGPGPGVGVQPPGARNLGHICVLGLVPTTLNVWHENRHKIRAWKPKSKGVLVDEEASAPGSSSAVTLNAAGSHKDVAPGPRAHFLTHP